MDETIDSCTSLQEELTITSSSSRSLFKVTNHQFKTIFWSIIWFLSGISSFLIAWGECTVWLANNKVSIIGYILQSSNSSLLFYIGLPIFSYFICCGYYTLFHMKLFTLYGMYKNKKSDINSLLLSSSFLLRIFAPLSYNFILMYQLDADAFLNIIGDIKVFPIIGNNFNEFFPIFITLISILHYFNISQKLLKCLGIKIFQASLIDDDNDHIIQEGKMLFNQQIQLNQRNKQRQRLIDTNDSDLLL